MKPYISKKTLFASITLSALVLAGLYAMRPEQASSSRAVSALPDTPSTSTTNNTLITSKPGASEIPAGRIQQAASSNDKTVLEEPESAVARSGQDIDIAALEKSHQASLTQRDLALPPPTAKNVMTEATGEYADQINQQLVLLKAQSENSLPPDVPADSHPPSGKNVIAEPQGENSREVSQQALIDKAKAEGYALPEVAPDSHPPTGKNVASEPQGEYAREISQPALIDKAKADGYPFP